MLTKEAPGRRAFVLRYRGKEVALSVGEHVIGRADECSIVIVDELVSRRHARLIVTETGVRLEDLGSANGVFVNEVRVRRPYDLDSGDRVVIGTYDLMLYEDPHARGTRVISDLIPAARDSSPGSKPPSPTAHTTRAEAFKVVGGLADRLLGRGDAKGAARVLAGHVRTVIAEASNNAPIDDELLDTAARYCLQLGAALGEGIWIERAIEMHLKLDRVMSPDVLSPFGLALKTAGDFDRALFRRYQDSIRGRMSMMTDNERERAKQILAFS